MVFDPYLSSRPLANALLAAPDGKLILNGQYYTFSSVVFYTVRDVLMLNGKFQNLEYGAYAPHAPSVFIDDTELPALWSSPQRCYLLTQARVWAVSPWSSAPRICSSLPAVGESFC